MNSVRKICSDILTSLKAYNLDDSISYRYIKSLLFDKASIFIRQDAKLREVYKLGNLWTPFCIDFEEVPMIECVKIGCRTLMKSKIRIPDTYQTATGITLKVFNADYSKEFNITQPSNYRDILLRPYKSDTGYFWVIDNFIYIPDSSIETGIVLGMFKEGAQINSQCQKPLDNIFSYPDYIISLVKTEVVKEILGSHKQINSDENPDLNNNTKN